MKVNNVKAVLEFDMNELDSLAFMIDQYLKSTIREHYNRLQQNKDGENVFFDHKNKNLEMLEIICSLRGRRIEYDQMIAQYKRMFAERRKERESKPTTENQ